MFVNMFVTSPQPATLTHGRRRGKFRSIRYVISGGIVPFACAVLFCCDIPGRQEKDEGDGDPAESHGWKDMIRPEQNEGWKIRREVRFAFKPVTNRCVGSVASLSFNALIWQE